MSRGLGRLQTTLLDALREHGRPASLNALACLAGGAISDLGSCKGQAPARSAVRGEPWPCSE